MANGRPGDSITHDIVHHGQEIFGPSCDGLVREIHRRLPPERIGALRDLIEPWPFAPDGTPRDTDQLFMRLAALRDSLDPPPRQVAGRALRALLAAILGFVAGGVAIGLAAGVLAFLIGALVGASQFEGAFAMGVAAMMPLAGVIGGSVLGAWFAWRSWRRSGRAASRL